MVIYVFYMHSGGTVTEGDLCFSPLEMKLLFYLFCFFNKVCPLKSDVYLSHVYIFLLGRPLEQRCHFQFGHEIS